MVSICTRSNSFCYQRHNRTHCLSLKQNGTTPSSTWIHEEHYTLSLSLIQAIAEGGTDWQSCHSGHTTRSSLGSVSYHTPTQLCYKWVVKVALMCFRNLPSFHQHCNTLFIEHIYNNMLQFDILANYPSSSTFSNWFQDPVEYIRPRKPSYQPAVSTVSVKNPRNWVIRCTLS